MEVSDLPEPLRRRMAEVDAQPALETVRSLLGGFVSDAESLDDLRTNLERIALTSTRAHRRYLTAIETVLAEQHPPRTLLELVEGYGNWPLDDPTDAGAAAFLRQVAEVLRSVLGSQA